MQAPQQQQRMPERPLSRLSRDNSRASLVSFAEDDDDMSSTSRNSSAGSSFADEDDHDNGLHHNDDDHHHHQNSNNDQPTIALLKASLQKWRQLEQQQEQALRRNVTAVQQQRPTLALEDRHSTHVCEVSLYAPHKPSLSRTSSQRSILHNGSSHNNNSNAARRQRRTLGRSSSVRFGNVSILTTTTPTTTTTTTTTRTASTTNYKPRKDPLASASSCHEPRQRPRTISIINTTVDAYEEQSLARKAELAAQKEQLRLEKRLLDEYVQMAQSSRRRRSPRGASTTTNTRTTRPFMNRSSSTTVPLADSSTKGRLMTRFMRGAPGHHQQLQDDSLQAALQAVADNNSSNDMSSSHREQVTLDMASILPSSPEDHPPPCAPPTSSSKMRHRSLASASKEVVRILSEDEESSCADPPFKCGNISRNNNNKKTATPTSAESSSSSTTTTTTTPTAKKSMGQRIASKLGFRRKPRKSQAKRKALHTIEDPEDSTASITSSNDSTSPQAVGSHHATTPTTHTLPPEQQLQAGPSLSDLYGDATWRSTTTEPRWASTDHAVTTNDDDETTRGNQWQSVVLDDSHKEQEVLQSEIAQLKWQLRGLHQLAAQQQQQG